MNKEKVLIILLKFQNISYCSTLFFLSNANNISIALLNYSWHYLAISVEVFFSEYIRALLIN